MHEADVAEIRVKGRLLAISVGIVAAASALPSGFIVEKAEELVKAANNNGGKDNIAVVLIEPFAE